MGKHTTAGSSIYRNSVISLVLLPRKKPSPILLGDWEVPGNLHFHLVQHHLAHTSFNIFFFFNFGKDLCVMKGQISIMLSLTSFTGKITPDAIPNVARRLLGEIFLQDD